MLLYMRNNYMMSVTGKKMTLQPKIESINNSRQLTQQQQQQQQQQSTQPTQRELLQMQLQHQYQLLQNTRYKQQQLQQQSIKQKSFNMNGIFMNKGARGGG